MINLQHETQLHFHHHFQKISEEEKYFNCHKDSQIIFIIPLFLKPQPSPDLSSFCQPAGLPRNFNEDNERLGADSTTTDRSNRINPRKHQMANISDQTEINWSEKN